MSEGIPVDLLVDIEDRYERLTPNRANGDRKTDLALTDQIDDPFDICSMQRKIPNDDIGLELGLALEKSIKFHSQANQMKGQKAECRDSQDLDLGILVNLEESPDKKELVRSTENHQLAGGCSKDSETAFNNPSNPFQLAWDVIEQEALNLADHIQHNKDKSIISPLKMVDLAMWQTPDSPLISPTKPVSKATEVPFLIKSSPDLDQRVKAKPMRPTWTRRSFTNSPALTKACTTPLRTRARPQNSPMRVATSKASSPVKAAVPRTSFKTPLMRSSVSVPLGCLNTTRTTTCAAPAIANPAIATPAIATPAIATPAIATPAVATPAVTTPAVATPAVGVPTVATALSGLSKAQPMKAIHSVSGISHLPTRSSRTSFESPMRRANVVSTPSQTPRRSLIATPSSVQQTLSRAGSDLTHQLLRKTAATLQRQSAIRRPSVSANLPSSHAPLAASASAASTYAATPTVPTVQRRSSLRYGVSKRVSFTGPAGPTTGGRTSSQTVNTATTGVINSSSLSGGGALKGPVIKSALFRSQVRCKENQVP